MLLKYQPWTGDGVTVTTATYDETKGIVHLIFSFTPPDPYHTKLYVYWSDDEPCPPRYEIMDILDAGSYDKTYTKTACKCYCMHLMPTSPTDPLDRLYGVIIRKYEMTKPPTPVPDCRIKSIDTPYEAKVGETVTVKVTYHNQGDTGITACNIKDYETGELLGKFGHLSHPNCQDLIGYAYPSMPNKDLILLVIVGEGDEHANVIRATDTKTKVIWLKAITPEAKASLISIIVKNLTKGVDYTYNATTKTWTPESPKARFGDSLWFTIVAKNIGGEGYIYEKIIDMDTGSAETIWSASSLPTNTELRGVSKVYTMKNKNWSVKIEIGHGTPPEMAYEDKVYTFKIR